MRPFMYVIAVVILASSARGFADFKWESTTNKVIGALSDTEVHTRFTLSNTGGGVVNILEVKPSCGCTTFKLDKKTLYAGESALLDLTIRTDDHVGEFSKAVAVSIDDGGKETSTVLAINIDIPNPLLITPNNLTWDKDSISVHKTIRISLQGDISFHITGIESSHTGIRSLLAASTDGKNYSLEVWPTSTDTRMEGTLILHTDLKTPGPEKRFVINVSIE